MADLLFIAITIAFFVGCAALVRLCDRIIGPDSEHLLVDGTTVDEPAGETVGVAR